MARVTKKVSGMSKMTLRAKMITKGEVAQIRPARSPVRSSDICRARNQTSSEVASAVSADGTRAAHSERPKALNDAATSQKKAAGLSRQVSVS